MAPLRGNGELGVVVDASLAGRIWLSFFLFQALLPDSRPDVLRILRDSGWETSSGSSSPLRILKNRSCVSCVKKIEKLKHEGGEPSSAV